MGFRSSFNFVPERYAVDPALRAELTAAGFEVGVHGLNHDGKLYSSKAEFDRRAVQINDYIREWGAVGFRSPAMHHNLEWLKALDIEYDASTFDTDPFEPQPDGVGTVFPFWVARDDGSGYVELPYTLAQDFTLFVLMKEKGIDLCKGFYLDIIGVLHCMPQIILRLLDNPTFSTSTECFGKPYCHLGRNAKTSVKQRRKGFSGHTETLGRFGHGKA
jgi:hypothetical protein